MLRQTLNGITEATADHRHGNMRSARETAKHLCECYLMLAHRVEGKEYEWGSFQPQAATWDDLQEEMFALRKSATDMALATNDDEMLWRLHEFVAGHDQYHVGQLCALRLDIQPDWDYYSIYRE